MPTIQQLRNFSIIFNIRQSNYMFFKFLIITSLIIFIFPKLLRCALKGFVASQMNKVQKEFYQEQRNASTQTKKEGKIDIDFVPPKAGKNSDDFRGGEYVSYEEVKD